MNNSTEEKKLLIESMKKLVTHVSNNPQRQKEIFDALSLQDLNKIILNLRDDNECTHPPPRFTKDIRTSSKRNWQPPDCLAFNLVMDEFASVGYQNLSINTPPRSRVRLKQERMFGTDADTRVGRMYILCHTEEEDRICWIINLERKTLKLQLLEYKKYSSFTFIDPLKNIFGFSSFQTTQQPRKEGKEMQVSVERAKDVEGRPLTSPLNQSTHLNSEFYKNYLQSRNRSKDSKRDSFSSNYANMSVDLGEGATRPGFTRPITSRQNVNNYTTRQQPNSSFDHRPNPIQNISQYARNGYNNNTKMTRSTYEPSTREVHEPLTDRRTEEPQVRGQEGRRIASGQTSPMNSTHEKFYKRVKDILKK